MPEQPQTISRCANLREECRGAIFDHIDVRHVKVMGALTEIRETLAYQKGQQNGAAVARKETAEHEPVRGLVLTPRQVLMVLSAIGTLVTAVIIAMKNGVAE